MLTRIISIESFHNEDERGDSDDMMYDRDHDHPSHHDDGDYDDDHRRHDDNGIQRSVTHHRRIDHAAFLLSSSSRKQRPRRRNGDGYDVRSIVYFFLAIFTIIPIVFVASSDANHKKHHRHHHYDQRLSSSSSSSRKKMRTKLYNDALLSSPWPCRGGAKSTLFVLKNKTSKNHATAPNTATTTTTTSSNPTTSSMNLRKRLEITMYFALWYVLNVYYNIINKQLLNIVPSPLIIGTAQLGIGGIYCLVLWLLRLRSIPTLRLNLLTAHGRDIWQVGWWHSLGQLASMVSLTAGSVSFTHIVKALEPFFSALVSILLFRHIMPYPVYLTLIPVVGGVAYACLQEHNFSWLSFDMAMISNVAFAFRAVYSKYTMTRYKQLLSSVNLYGLATWSSFLLSIPLVYLTSSFTSSDDMFGSHLSKFLSSWKQSSLSSRTLLQMLVISGIVHYLNNEVMYLALDNVHPITLAVGNTMKRIFIIFTSILVFRNPITWQAVMGSTIGIMGVLSYALVKQHYEAKEKVTQQKSIPEPLSITQPKHHHHHHRLPKPSFSKNRHSFSS